MIGKLQKKLPIVTADPVELSNRVIDSGDTDESVNRITQQLSEVADGISIVESFSHVISFQTDAGLVCFDASGPFTGGKVVEALRGWSTAPVHSLVYTHGHIDHVGGSGALHADAAERSHPDIAVVAHDAVERRFERYQLTNGWNNAINRRQFGGISKGSGMALQGLGDFLPADTLWPTQTYESAMALTVGGLDIELHHDRGETDDHTWAWIPEHKAICVGDFLTWVFPNCGNPQKVQRYPKEWAVALRKMQTKGAELMFGAHGLPVSGAKRVDQVLDDLATTLESLVLRTLALMNDGEPLDTVLQEVTVAEDVLSRPWMRPIYDEPEFVVRNIWRMYGGWWNQNPAELKPAANAALGAELASLAGGALTLVSRAQELADEGEHRLACHLIEFAVAAEPESHQVHAARAEIYQARRNSEYSLMSKGIFAAAANESKAVLEQDSGG